MKATLATLIISAFFLTGTAEASNYNSVFSRGIHSGQLTKGETASLQAQMRAIASFKIQARRDGRITAKERSTLARMESRYQRSLRIFTSNRARR